MATRWIPVVLWAAVIFAFSSIPSLNTGWDLWDYVLRKCAHVTEYAILAVLLVRATGSARSALLLTVAYACTDELHQHFVQGRHGTPIDVGFDTVGALIGLAVWRRLSEWNAAR